MGESSFLCAFDTHALVLALICSRLDYGDSLCYGLPAVQPIYFQALLSSASRLFYGGKKTKPQNWLRDNCSAMAPLPISLAIPFLLYSCTLSEWSLHRVSLSYSIASALIFGRPQLHFTTLGLLCVPWGYASNPQPPTPWHYFWNASIPFPLQSTVIAVIALSINSSSSGAV